MKFQGLSLLTDVRAGEDVLDAVAWTRAHLKVDSRHPRVHQELERRP